MHVGYIGFPLNNLLFGQGNSMADEELPHLHTDPSLGSHWVRQGPSVTSAEGEQQTVPLSNSLRVQ